jgi:hypothetical protein
MAYQTLVNIEDESLSLIGVEVNGERRTNLGTFLTSNAFILIDPVFEIKHGKPLSPISLGFLPDKVNGTYK